MAARPALFALAQAYLLLGGAAVLSARSPAGPCAGVDAPALALGAVFLLRAAALNAYVWQAQLWKPCAVAARAAAPALCLASGAAGIAFTAGLLGGADCLHERSRIGSLRRADVLAALLAVHCAEALALWAGLAYAACRRLRAGPE